MHDQSSLQWVLKNLFLALAPVALAQAIYWLASVRDKTLLLKIGIGALAAVWLAFLPNTCYLLTEWRHFLRGLDSTDLYLRSQFNGDMTLLLMKYTVFYFCYSGIGMLMFTLAIRPIARLGKKTGATVWVWGLPLFLMLSVGVYLGLILRYNSWDLATRPGVVWDSMVEILFRPKLSAFIVAFAGFLWLSYAAIDIWIDGFIGRWTRGIRKQLSGRSIRD